MRLLHCERSPQDNHITLSFEVHHGEATPEYAILSHRWGPTQDEVSFNDINSGSVETKPGYAKVQGCCTQALEDDFHYVWIDSCCIDKSSSAELSEAINSMYRYYANSAVCYAYLEDVHDEDDPRRTESSFGQSEWFFRGWTLQELIAPRLVSFFSNGWIELGTRAALADEVQEITGIEKKFLAGHPVSDANIAKRMSWAAYRTTTRVEDQAYSLMGLFDVHMPAIYGEGEKAFMRLQLEILKTSNDYTIFAWDDRNRERCGMLAEHPRLFWRGCSVERTERRGCDERAGKTTVTPHYQLTNFGLHIWLPVEQGFSICGYGDSVIRAALACRDTSSQPPENAFFITLLPTNGHYERVGRSVALEKRENASESIVYEELFIAESPVSLGIQPRLLRIRPLYQRLEVQFPKLPVFELVDYFPRRFPSKPTKSESSFVLLPDAWGKEYNGVFWNSSTKEVIVVFGKFKERKVWLDVSIFTSDKPPEAQDLQQEYHKNPDSGKKSLGVLWLKGYLPVSRKQVILSAKEMECRPWPWEYRGSGEKLEITLRTPSLTKDQFVGGVRSRL